MTTQMSRTWMRWTLAAGLVVAWLCVFVAWRGYPQGAATTIQCLVGFMALGLAPWIAPSMQWSKLLRAAGAVTAFVAFALLVWVEMLLMGGL